MSNGTRMDQYTPSKNALQWGEHYQTDKDYEGMRDFDLRSSIGGPENEGIANAISNIMPGYEGELRDMGYSQDDFSSLLQGVAYKESEGGKYDRQHEGGPAQGWWQVEPNTARDMVTARHDDGSSNVSNQYWGPKMEAITGFSAQQLYDMDDEELGATIRDNPKVGAGMAGGKFIKSWRNKASKGT